MSEAEKSEFLSFLLKIPSENLTKRAHKNYQANAFKIDNMKMITSLENENFSDNSSTLKKDRTKINSTELLDYSIIKTDDLKKLVDQKERYRTERNEKHEI